MRTEADELFTTLYHLDNARKALLRTGWTSHRDKVLHDLDSADKRIRVLLAAEYRNHNAFVGENA
jgi:hypothetical protein